MKNFEEIQLLWSQQAVVAHDSMPAIQAVQKTADRIVNSRRRLLRLGVAMTVFFIFVSQLLMVVNFVYGGRTPNVVSLVHFGVAESCLILFLIALLRRIRADRELRAKSASSVRENMGVSLELIEREMREYRWFGSAFAFVVLLDVVPLLNGYHLGYFDLSGLVQRLTFVAVFVSILGRVALRHYRRVLEPQRQDLQAVLAELDAE